MNEIEMDRATKHLPTKSAKIRTLDKMGVRRGDIARFLKIKYQHVRNVLVQGTPASEANQVNQNVRQAATVIAEDHRPLSIEEAKLGLAVKFGVSPNLIEITIRG